MSFLHSLIDSSTWRSSLILLLLVALLTGCGSASQARKMEEDEFLSRFPPVSPSEDLIHSPDREMSAHVPVNWVLLDAAKLESPEIFAVACSPDYTVSLVFSDLALEGKMLERASEVGLVELAEISFQRRQKRLSGRALMVGGIEEWIVGKHHFAVYAYSTDSLRTQTRVGVFVTGRHAYECSVTHLTFTDRTLPSPGTLRDIHQLVLKTIEW